MGDFTFNSDEMDVYACDNCIYASSERHFDDDCPLCGSSERTKVDAVNT